MNLIKCVLTGHGREGGSLSGFDRVRSSVVGGVIGLGSLVALAVLIVLVVLTCTANKHRGMYCVCTCTWYVLCMHLYLVCIVCVHLICMCVHLPHH